VNSKVKLQERKVSALPKISRIKIKKKRLSRLKTLFRELRLEFLKFKRKVRGKLRMLKSYILRFEEQLKDVEQDVSSLQSQVKDVEKDFSSLEDQVEDLGKDVSSMESQVEDLEKDVSSMESQVQDLGNDVSSLASQVQDLGNNVSSLESRVAAVENDVSSLQVQLNDVQQGVASLQRQLTTGLINNPELQQLFESRLGQEVVVSTSGGSVTGSVMIAGINAVQLQETGTTNIVVIPYSKILTVS
jgi:chromosome segregation ATPase